MGAHLNYDMSFLKFSFISLSLFLLSSCSDSREEFYYDHHPSEEGNLTWSPASFPLLIHVPEEMEPYEVAIEKAAHRWNEVLGQKAIVFVFDRTPNTQWSDPKESLSDGISGLYQQLIWDYESVGSTVLAYTGTLSLNGQIQRADLIFNFQSFNFADYDAPPPHTNYIDFESVLVHELGHFLGLGHVTMSEDSQSVMLPSLRKAEERRILSPGDVFRLRNLYLRL